MSDLVFIGMVFELAIITCTVILLVLILMKYFQKKHQLTLYLFLIFLFYMIAIIFSWISKVLVLYSGVEYNYDTSIPDPGTLQSWFVFRIVDFRFSFFFLAIAIFISYVLKVNVFEKGYNRVHKIIVIIYGIITMAFSLLGYIRGNTLPDAPAFLLIFLFMAMIYFPFFISSYKSFKLAKGKTFKNAFISLALMSIFYILVPFNFLIDRLLIQFGGPGFSLFYFLAWIFVLLGMIASYFGYIRPKASE
ncbi:MAG: hypothetical protein MUP85_14760 [Candidatus Lokiarchaeota archaeon]|nr:hypothetical protein [Candidatus Lokiarchaeota archaeon]